MAANPDLHPEDLACGFFTLTEDLSSVFPAEAAREIGWQQVPLLCSREVPVPGSLPKCIRVLLLWNTNIPQERVQHVYLKEAQVLRPDLNHT
jgi:chorismate mutase